ncbi:hypothetical protein TKK_0006378 [Trichogramma kaykai]
MSDFYKAYSQAYRRAYRYGTNENPGQSTGDFLNKQKLINLRETVRWEVGEDRSEAYEKTALHTICGACSDDTELAEMVFDISDEKHRAVHVNAQDKLGRTPLYMAVENKHRMLVELLLTKGSDPNLAEAKGMTPLHLICPRLNDDNVGKCLKIFINICYKNHRKLQVDVQDKFGKTPLQLAVTNLMPEAVNVLLDHGADLSKFIFPTEDDFFERFDPQYAFRLGFKLVLASSRA